MQCDRQRGWRPWIPQGDADVDTSPYQYAEVLLARQEWDTCVRVNPFALDPMMNVCDLWWRPVPGDPHA
jgi:hypothetical protein